ncbi:MAG: cytochrome c biogenesis protein CcsA [Acidobacteria bacterium]|nr:cytochrome c biogenesis protein CcsA [Acidobacteriota bacterium]
MIRRFFTPLFVLSMLLFAAAPVLIANAPYEATMGLVAKIFYFHAPCAWLMLISAFVCGIWSAIYLFQGRPHADRMALAAAELTAVFGLLALVTGPLWARKAWGVWWQWDARLTSSLLVWMIFLAYLLVRNYGGPGSEKLAAAMALFGMANVPFVYVSVNIWRTVHPKTSVVPTLPVDMGGPFWFCVAAFLLLYLLMLTMRVRLEEQRARLEELYRVGES